MSNSRFLLDENIPIEVKEFLEFKGFSVKYSPKGVVNGKVALLAKEGKLVLLTRDTDFLNADLFPPKEFSGVVVFRIHPPRPEKLVEATTLLLERIKDFKGKLFIVGEGWLKITEG
jgi:predicted nuclease of predicted toxin-antitoxin system